MEVRNQDLVLQGEALAAWTDTVHEKGEGKLLSPEILQDETIKLSGCEIIFTSFKKR